MLGARDDPIGLTIILTYGYAFGIDRLYRHEPSIPPQLFWRVVMTLQAWVHLFFWIFVSICKNECFPLPGWVRLVWFYREDSTIPPNYVGIGISHGCGSVPVSESSGWFYMHEHLKSQLAL